LLEGCKDSTAFSSTGKQFFTKRSIAKVHQKRGLWFPLELFSESSQQSTVIPIQAGNSVRKSIRSDLPLGADASVNSGAPQVGARPEGALKKIVKKNGLTCLGALRYKRRSTPKATMLLYEKTN